MTNQEVLESWVKGEAAQNNKCSRLDGTVQSSLSTDGRKLYSYKTIIAGILGNEVWFTKEQYSATTSKQLTTARVVALSSGKVEVEEFVE